MVLTFLKREQFQTNQSLLKTGNFWLVFFLVGLQISSRMGDLKITVCRQGRAEQRLKSLHNFQQLQYMSSNHVQLLLTYSKI